MRSFFAPFEKSAKEFGSLRCICITGIFIAVSVVLEMFSIPVTPYIKVNFAFIAVAVIGMLFGPVVCFPAAMICDIIGIMVSPTAGFLPAYTLVAGVQGLIYGLCLYTKLEFPFGKRGSDTRLGINMALFSVRIVVARLLDVIIINLLCNTVLNMHYGFIPQEALGVAIKARIFKNVVELAADLPLMFVVLPAAYLAYRRMSGSRTAA